MCRAALATGEGKNSVSAFMLQGHPSPFGHLRDEYFEGPSWHWPNTDYPHPPHYDNQRSRFFHLSQLLVWGQCSSFNFQKPSTLNSLYLELKSEAQTLTVPIPKDLKVFGNCGWTCNYLSHTTGSSCLSMFKRLWAAPTLALYHAQSLIIIEGTQPKW